MFRRTIILIFGIISTGAVICAVAAASFSLPTSSASTELLDDEPGTHDGKTLLITNWTVTPAGRQVSPGVFPSTQCSRPI